MKRELLLLAALLLCLVGTVPTGSARELLTNPSFEEGTNVVPWDDTIPPTGWQKYGNWGWAGWKENRPAHTGTRFVDAGAWNYGQYGVWHQDISVDPGDVLLCSIWAMTEGWGADPHASMMVQFRNAASSTLSTDRLDIFTGTQPSPNVWTQYALMTGPAPAGTTYARFLLRGEAQCTAMFDDASVVALSAKLSPDINDDGVVNFRDCAALAQAWLCDPADPHVTMCDLDGDGSVGPCDLETLAGDWLAYDEYVTIEIDPTVTFQEMDGFGASLTDSSAWLIFHVLTEQQRRGLMEDLFDPNVGIGLSYLRQPMGSSDFRLTDYTYDDMPAGQTDYELENFSIAHDQEYIIPLLQEALAINPNIKIMGSPWSPPAWMKTSGELGYGRLVNSDTIYDAYAEYFVKFIQAYAADGVPIDAVTLQNEPHYEPHGYPGMRMYSSEQARLAIRLGQRFQANGIDTKIVIWDHNWDNPYYPIFVLDNTEAKPYIAGTAFHGYAGEPSAQLQVVQAHPDKDIYFTECSGGEWGPHFGDNLIWDTSNLIIDAVRCWAKTVVKWNLALDENHGPKIDGGCSDCRGVVTIKRLGRRAEVVREVEYYSLGHASKFVTAGARRIDSTEQPGQNIENVAFVNTNGSTVVIVLNPNTSRQNVELRWNGESLIYGLPGRSVTTFKWSDEPDPKVGAWITTGDQAKLLERQLPTRFH